ncbi:MAG: hypothetical protein P8186_04255 [Anaerolineae bacterium]
MNLRFLYTGGYAYNLNPTFSSYVQKSLGKTVDTSRDAWVHLNEGYRRYYIDGKWRDVAMKNFERYLYQRDLPGARTVAVERAYRNKAGGENMQNPPWGTGTPFDLVARRTDRANGNDRMYFNVEDGFIHNESQTVLLKVTYKDDNGGQWHVEYDAGSDGILSTPAIIGVNDGQWKTATFVLGRATFAGQLSYEQDLAIVADFACQHTDADCLTNEHANQYTNPHTDADCLTDQHANQYTNPHNYADCLTNQHANQYTNPHTDADGFTD